VEEPRIECGKAKFKIGETGVDHIASGRKDQLHVVSLLM